MSKRFWHIIIILCLHVVAKAQVSDFRRAFDEFTANARTSYYTFSDSLNAVFAESLKEDWLKYKTEDAIERSSVPEPTEAPVVTGKEQPSNRSINVLEEKSITPSQCQK